MELPPGKWSATQLDFSSVFFFVFFGVLVTDFGACMEYGWSGRLE